MAKQFVTITAGIHNPGGWKSAAMKRAMVNTDLVYSQLLHKFREDVEHLAALDDVAAETVDKTKRKEIISSRRNLSFLLAKESEKYARRHPICSAAAGGVSSDFMAQVDSYLALRGEHNGQYPRTYNPGIAEPDYYADGLSAACQSFDEESYNAARDLMATRQKGDTPRPLTIPRYRKGDGFQIFMNESGQFFAMLFLLRQDSRYCRDTKIDGLIDIRTGEITDYRTKIGFLVPIRFSQDIYDEYLRYVLRPGYQKAIDIKTAKVMMTAEGEFRLAISLEVTVPDIEPVNIMGIDRGINELAVCTVTDKSGNLIETFSITGADLRHYQRTHEKKRAERQRYGYVKHAAQWSRYADHIAHAAAKQIAELAAKHSAQVVMEDLTAISNGAHHKRPKGQRRTKFNILLNRQQYGKIQKFLEYTLVLRGLPKPKLVRAAFTSITCPCCGHQDKANRPARESFKCAACSYEQHADSNASHVIAIKSIYEDWLRPQLKKGAKLKDSQTFKHWMLTEFCGAAVRRCESAAISHPPGSEIESYDRSAA